MLFTPLWQYLWLQYRLSWGLKLWNRSNMMITTFSAKQRKLLDNEHSATAASGSKIFNESVDSNLPSGEFLEHDVESKSLTCTSRMGALHIAYDHCAASDKKPATDEGTDALNPAHVLRTPPYWPKMLARLRKLGPPIKSAKSNCPHHLSSWQARRYLPHLQEMLLETRPDHLDI